MVILSPALVLEQQTATREDLSTSDGVVFCFLFSEEIAPKVIQAYNYFNKVGAFLRERRITVIVFVVGAFFVLHGLVHLLYFGQSWRIFELQPGMVWPDGSWAFSGLLGDHATRLLTSISCIIAAAGFVIGGAGIFFGQSWWRTVVVASAAFSGVLYILFWNGRLEHLDNQGGVGLLIDVVILVTVLVLRWPEFDF